jgi:hypothetical protein
MSSVATTIISAVVRGERSSKFGTTFKFRILDPDSRVDNVNVNIGTCRRVVSVINR